MSSNHDESHGHSSNAPTPKSSFSAAFWFVIVLVGLFIAALNFIDIMGHSEHEKESKAPAEAHATTPE